MFDKAIEIDPDYPGTYYNKGKHQWLSIILWYILIKFKYFN